MHRARHLVDVLPARALRPDGADLDLGRIDRADRSIARRDQTRSKIAAMPWPPPMHIVTSA